MSFEKSCGAVCYTKINNEIYWVIICSLEGIYGFPKGHVENDETEIETALREVWEETALKPRIIDGFRAEQEYPLPRKKGVIKKVVYFLAEYEGQELKYLKDELKSAELLKYDEAYEKLQFQNAKDVLKSANDFLNNIL